jgi:hypothetical protein
MLMMDLGLSVHCRAGHCDYATDIYSMDMKLRK